MATGVFNIVQYERKDGKSPFGAWFASLDLRTRLRITSVLARMEKGNFSNTKSLGRGVRELKINVGPGYRVYFGMDGGALVVLLAGGAKKSQSRDIETARKLWIEYKGRKKEGDIKWH